ncbi:hypothetical protein [Pedobacter gandavensis]|nr:hypothetical protein [Pedobacter gandavensis]
MKTIIVVVNNGLVKNRVWSDKLYAMPVQQVQIDRSKGVLVQTPGYN